MTDFPLVVARPSADEIQAHRRSFGGAGHLTHRRTAELQLIKHWLGHLCSAVEQECEAVARHLLAALQESHGRQVCGPQPKTQTVEGQTRYSDDDDDDVQLELAG